MQQFSLHRPRTLQIATRGIATSRPTHHSLMETARSSLRSQMHARSQRQSSTRVEQARNVMHELWMLGNPSRLVGRVRPTVDGGFVCFDKRGWGGEGSRVLRVGAMLDGARPGAEQGLWLRHGRSHTPNEDGRRGTSLPEKVMVGSEKNTLCFSRKEDDTHHAVAQKRPTSQSKRRRFAVEKNLSRSQCSSRRFIFLMTHDMTESRKRQ